MSKIHNKLRDNTNFCRYFIDPVQSCTYLLLFLFFFSFLFEIIFVARFRRHNITGRVNDYNRLNFVSTVPPMRAADLGSRRCQLQPAAASKRGTTAVA